MVRSFSIGINYDLPKGPIVDSIMELKRELVDDFGSRHTFLPGISINLAAFPRYNFKKMKEDLRSLSFPEFEVVCGSISYNPRFAFVFLEIRDKTSMLQKFHEVMLDLINEYREGLLRPGDRLKLDRGKLTKIEEQMLNRYGSFRVRENFVKHITLGMIKTNADKVREFIEDSGMLVKSIEGKKVLVDKVSVILFETDKGEVPVDKFTLKLG